MFVSLCPENDVVDVGPGKNAWKQPIEPDNRLHAV